jgi:hypothetical protein
MANKKLGHDSMQAKIHFDKLVEISKTTGQCFSYWCDKMSKIDRIDLCKYLSVELNWTKVLYKILEASNR